MQSRSGKHQVVQGLVEVWFTFRISSKSRGEVKSSSGCRGENEHRWAMHKSLSFVKLMQ